MLGNAQLDKVTSPTDGGGGSSKEGLSVEWLVGWLVGSLEDLVGNDGRHDFFGHHFIEWWTTLQGQILRRLRVAQAPSGDDYWSSD